MKREEIADLMAFVVVAEERSFTRAAARLSMAQSALSQIVRRIEERLGLRLLTRTTRSVVPTEAGEHLLSVLGPMLHDIDSALTSLSDLQNRPSGTIRITTVEHAAKTILLPAMRTFLKSHPEIDIQLTIDYGLTDVVSERFDLPYDQVERAIKGKKLIRVLDKFTPDLPGYHLYYPHRRHAGSAFSLFIDRLKYKGAV